MKEIKIEIGNRLKKLRELKGLTQKELAEYMNCTQRWWSRCSSKYKCNIGF